MIEEFDRIFVISDLHLGGAVGCRAFREAGALQRFILRARDDDAKRVALVINGDVFDFLAYGEETPEFNFHPEALLRGMAVTGDELQPVFEALSAFARDPRDRQLVLQIGNHDIELALPSAQQTLRELLQLTDPLHIARLRFEASGRGWLCKVGVRLVQVMHGNAWDPWNDVDQDGLDAAARAAARPGERAVAPRSNAGTLMVCKVLNRIKSNYPFVDLLKPENEPLMAVMAAIDAPSSYRGLALAFGTRLAAGEMGELLRGGEDETSAAGMQAVAPAAEREVAAFLARVPMVTDGALALERAEQNLEQGRRVRDLVVDDRGRLRALRSVGRVRLQQIAGAVERLRGQPGLASLRLALKRWLADDRSFNIGNLSPIDLRILDGALRMVDVVIAGHTHLPRHQFGQPEYINTGTWMRVLKLNGTALLESDAAFQGFFGVVGRRHSLAELDALNLDPRLRPVAVVDHASARLCSVQEDGSFDGHVLS
jgi:UDP-2,3-diacylglucosamine pyrophosphatase LpxH